MVPQPKAPHPIPYQGSKRRLAPTILSYFPERVSRLVEPFAGSAAISLAALLRGIPSQVWINDAHEPLINLWKSIANSPDILSDHYEQLWHDQEGRERRFFDEVRSQFNQSHEPHHFLYLLARCVKAAIRYNPRGEFNNTPDNRRKGARPTQMRGRITGASQLLAGRSTFSSRDYKEVLGECTEGDLIYMDPPYQGVSNAKDNRYAPKVDHEEFCHSLALLNKKGCDYIVSYDGRTGDKEYGDHLPDDLFLERIEVNAGRSTQATLLGRDDLTYESLYISEGLSEVFALKQEATQRKLFV